MIIRRNTPAQSIRLTGILVAIAITGLTGCHQSSPTQSAPLVHTAYKVNAVKTEIPTDDLALEYSGVVVPIQRTELSFQLPGSVSQIFIDEGDTVKKGQKLAVIDKSRYRSGYDAALAVHRQALDAYERMQSVYNKGSLPQIKWQEVVSKLQQSDSALQIAKDNLKHCTLKAPSNGTVSMKRIEPGVNVTPNISVIELIGLDTVYIRISVPENEIPQLQKGQQGKVVITALGPKVFLAQVEQIGVAAHLVSKTYEVKLLVKNADHVIRPGMASVVNLEIPRAHKYPTVPMRAVQEDETGRKYVFVVNEQKKKAIRQDIKLGGFYKNDVVVTSGIKGGEVVVVDGQHKLASNTAIDFRLLK